MMAPPTIRTAIKNCLKDLTAGELEEFKDALIAEKGVPTSSVEGENFLVVTRVIDTTFSDEALKVVIELLNDIGCKKKADALESKTRKRPKVPVDKRRQKARNPPSSVPDGPRCPTKRQRSLAEAPPESKTRKRPKVPVDNGDPALPRTSSGELETKSSQEALKIVADQKQAKASGNGGNVKKPEEVEADAKAHVRAEGGDPSNVRLVLSRFIIQFGKYKGQTFKWLLENHVGYAVYVAATHQDERKRKKDRSPLMVHKDFLTQYSIAYPEVLKEVKLFKTNSTASRPAQGKRKTRRKKK